MHPQISQSGVRLKYAVCDKEGLLHENQPCNIICTEIGCVSNSLCCCFCAQQYHSQHKTKLLKAFISEAQQQTNNYSQNPYNLDVIFDISSAHKKQILEEFYCLRKQLMGLLDKQEHSIMTFFKHINDKLTKDKADLRKEIYTSISILQKGELRSNCQIQVRNLFNLLYCLQSQKQNKNASQENLIQNLLKQAQNIKKIMIRHMEKAIKALSQGYHDLNGQRENSNMFRVPQNYQFCNQWKHQDIQIINESTAQSVNNQCYKFAILKPSAQAGILTKTIQFVIDRCTFGWIAVGICHKDIVLQNKFTIVPHKIGHGAYLISSNGGVWSNHMQEFNNKVKSFKFGKGDKIKLSINLHDKIIKFSKNLQSFSLPFQIIIGDQLHPCVLFYNLNDKIICINKSTTPQ